MGKKDIADARSPFLSKGDVMYAFFLPVYPGQKIDKIDPQKDIEECYTQGYCLFVVGKKLQYAPQALTQKEGHEYPCKGNAAPLLEAKNKSKKIVKKISFHSIYKKMISKETFNRISPCVLRKTKLQFDPNLFIPLLRW